MSGARDVPGKAKNGKPAFTRSRERIAPPPSVPVTFAYVHENEVSSSWHESVVGMIAHDFAHDAHFLLGGWLAMRGGTDGLPAARNMAVKGFLHTDVPWLYWTDTDMGFAPDTVDRLLAAADPEKRPIVGGLCFAQRERMQDGMGGYRVTASPTIYDWVTTPTGAKGFQSRSTYPINTLLRCSGTGSAHILIHRRVFEAVREKYGDVWYDRIANETMENQPISEDLSFCLRATALEFPVFIHTGVRATHHKELWLGESDYWQKAIAPPATERVDVLVPVLDRPQNAQPFMDSLRASTGLAAAWVVADAGDVPTINAWKQAGAHVLVRPLSIDQRPGSFAQKINMAYRITGEGGENAVRPAPWVFVTGDDVRFHAAWLDQAQAVAEKRYHVIGTNDLGNPRVIAGEHATHLLMRRSYVDEVGGSWDGPGVLAHEGYRHWFVDDELVIAAKQRGAWAMALGALVEHMHPLFGKGQPDRVYELGQSAARKDQAHFKDRMLYNRTKDVKKQEVPVASGVD